MVPATTVSIVLVTYNHEKFIRRAVESIASQHLDCEMEVILADDCSTDNTVKLALEFFEACGIKPLLLENNKNLGITKNYQRAFQACKGDYIAVLEGDDEWITNDRVDRHLKFLRDRPYCSMVFNRYLIVDQRRKASYLSDEYERDEFYTNDICRHNIIGNFSACSFRAKSIKMIPDSYYDLLVYDWGLAIYLSQFGLIGYIQTVSSAYYVKDCGVWSKKDEEAQDLQISDCIKSYIDYFGPDFAIYFIENRVYRRYLEGSYGSYEKYSRCGLPADAVTGSLGVYKASFFERMLNATYRHTPEAVLKFLRKSFK